MAIERRHLIPKANWAVRKGAVWLIVGPLNPLSWMIIVWMDDQLSGLIVALTIWPCCLGAAIGLMRLKHAEIGVTKLSEFVTGWTLLTLVIYTFVLVCGGTLYFQAAAAGGVELTHLVGVLVALPYALIALPFAFMYGGIPAIFAGLMSYWVIRRVLYETPSPSSATPSPTPVASSGQ